LPNFAAGLAASGLHPDSIRYGHKPLYHQSIFNGYATACPNAEALAAVNTERHQLVVGAFLDHSPRTEHQDPVRLGDVRQPVRDKHLVRRMARNSASNVCSARASSADVGSSRISRSASRHSAGATASRCR
jgi:hypothetical protein